MSDEDVDQQLLARVEHDVLWLTLHRPDAGNSFTHAMRNRLIEHFTDANHDDSVRAIVLTGAGNEHFCTGGDISPRPRPVRPEGAPKRISGEFARLIRSGVQRLIASMLDCEKPIVAAVNGTAAGAGTALVLASDLVIAADHARFIQAYVRRGLVPDGGPTYLLPRVVGLTKAKELVFFGDDLVAVEAERIGLVNKVVPGSEVLTAAREWAERLARGPTKAIGYSKRLLNRSLDADRATLFEEEALLMEMTTSTADFAEGITSFREHRPPEFRGF